MDKKEEPILTLIMLIAAIFVSMGSILTIAMKLFLTFDMWTVPTIVTRASLIIFLVPSVVAVHLIDTMLEKVASLRTAKDLCRLRRRLMFIRHVDLYVTGMLYSALSVFALDLFEDAYDREYAWAALNAFLCAWMISMIVRSGGGPGRKKKGSFALIGEKNGAILDALVERQKGMSASRAA